MKKIALLSFILMAGLYSTNLQAQESLAKDLLAREPSGMRQITVTPSVPAAAEHDIAPEQPAEVGKTPMDKFREAIGLKQPAYGINSTLTTKVPSYGKHSAEPEATQKERMTHVTRVTPPSIADNIETITGDFSELRQIDTSVARTIIDPLRIQLSDTRIIQLSGIDIPDFDPYDPGPVSAQVRDTLDALLRGKQVRLYQTKDSKTGRVNRMGDNLGHLVRVDGELWVQGALLSAGLARVRPTVRNPEMAAQMIALEDQARAQKRGLWASEDYAVLTPETAEGHENGFAIVRGRVVNSSLVNNTLYLNFGSNWRNDFTIAIAPSVRKAMVSKGINPQHLQGQTVRVHGWLESYNGPYMELIHPAWFEVLPDDGINPKVIHNQNN